MTDEQVVVQGPVKKAKVEKKAPRIRKGLTAEELQAHLQKITVAEVPTGWVGMSEICKAGQEQGIKVSRIVSAMGGDRALNAPWEPLFQVKYVGGRKYGSPEIMTKGFALLKDPEYHKTERKGRKKKEATESAGKPAVKVVASGVKVNQDFQAKK